jgi:hypothetical protein
MICGYGTAQIIGFVIPSSIATNGAQYIPPTQGYFVRAQPWKYCTSNAVRVNSGASNWLKVKIVRVITIT